MVKKPFKAKLAVFTMIYSLIAGIAIMGFDTADEDPIEIKNEPTKIMEQNNLEYQNAKTQKVAVTVAATLPKQEEQQPEWFRDVPLSKELQEYMYNMCQEFDFDYDLLLGMAWKESGFNTDAVSRTNDVGLLQINRSNQKWVNEMAGKKLNLKDPYDNILASLLILDSYRQHWIDKGIPEDKLMQYTLNSYNMGVTGYKRAGYPSRSYDRDIQRKADEIKNQK